MEYEATYPIILTKDGAYYVVSIPDFKINTQGTSLADAMEMARDAISMVGRLMLDEGRPLPEPSALDTVDKSNAGALAILLDVVFDEYESHRSS